EDRNEENQQKQNGPSEQLDTEKKNQQTQMNTNSADINVLNIDHEDVQAQVQENNIEKQADDGFITVMHKKVKIRKSTHNSRNKSESEGLNDRYKCQKTMTMLKTYKIELIMLQETNLTNNSTRNFLKQQWGYDSIWTARVAILAGNREIKFENIEESYQGRKESLSTVIQKQENGNKRNKDFWSWSKIKWINNKHKDIFWRYCHRSLPLGYRLKHIIPNNNGDCPMCHEEIQTNEHFGINCKSSKII
ncbi:5997_t:CDS:2, partial [Racocetra persica]